MLVWLVLGLLSGGAGATLVLVGLGVIPIAENSTEAPLWVIGLAGSLFLVMGIYSIGLGVLARRDPDFALRVLRGAEFNLGGWLVALFTVGVFFVLSVWVAWGPGPRTFSGGGNVGGIGVSGGLGESVGRAVFGVSAVITGLVGVWIAVWGIRRLWSR